jgi:methyl-accepting chemotaxis protein
VRVTSSHGNTVHTIDERPAWDVWRERTAHAAAQRGVDVARLRDDEIPGFLLQYEAGLSVGGEVKIRAPLSLGENGAINFACGIPKGTVFRVTESEPDRQVSSAREAARRARARLGGARPAGAVVFDCICRSLILGDRFGSAVQAISEELGDVPIAGFETYGEIALDVGDMSGFHNSTSVVLAFPEE